MNLQNFTHHTIHNMVISNLAENRNISLDEAKEIVSKMTFSEYHKLSEASADLTPPSGNAVGSSGPTGTTGSTADRRGQPPTGAQSTWTGKGPVTVGMTVGTRNKAGLSTPGEVSQVDQGANGVQIKNPETGKTEWHNISTLEPYMAKRSSDQSAIATKPGQEGFPMSQLMQMEDAADLMRLKELSGIPSSVGHDAGSYPHDFSSWQNDAQAAGLKVVKQQQDETGNGTQNFVALDRSGQTVGYWNGSQGSGVIGKNAQDYKQRIGNKGLTSYNNDQYQKDVTAFSESRFVENCSSGATGAGAIAIAPATMGGVKRRQPTDEKYKAEYTPKAAAKTIVGDTKPAQASGKLSADLAANGKKAAGRTRNGKKAR